MIINISCLVDNNREPFIKNVLTAYVIGPEVVVDNVMS